VNGPEPVEVDTPDDPGRLDGRAARSAKTRDAIADALLDLLAEAKLRPTAREIADRAAVSVRSVYVHFDDLEDLFCVAAKRHYTRIAPMLAPVAVTGPPAERAHALVRQRIRLYAKTGAVSRATRLHAESSPTLARILRDARTLSRNDLERIFGAELPGPRDPRRARTVAMLDVLTGPDTWETLREQHDLTVDDAMQCVIDSIVVQLRAVDA
jgi:TetR/AcrR family transcriptional regulator, regulator of autoinduction and epiphytic fitness